MAFATERLLPAYEQVPQEFKAGNLYTQLASAIFYGQPLPDARLELKPASVLRLYVVPCRPI
ncbi:hypothetical protein ABQW72_00650 [Xanthomonas hortorum pv. pelargonii]|uniref:hypothetical protein n=1 Tax=Xanthomonas hortorum TaxID=56454 RepID=UPI0021C7D4AD|nr:hypothetical protein [Xanthomonas hortorum]MCU1710240.1 hypothetical protein [Xanthomonas hortorum pv. pelargonii]WCI07358.1 hypothetical protein PML25_22430 [Xanthomonas hortorum pv. pelargonii]WOB33088.1 hypothetical protein NYR98_22275 [Xanthomonas hortorum pv. pelargonii]